MKVQSDSDTNNCYKTAHRHERRTNGSFTGERGRDPFPGSIMSVSNRHRRSYPEEDNIQYISLLCDLYAEAQNRKQRIAILEEITHVASNFM